jgi:NAD(P)-dependent dehydrogenase (short-subunit alcohol dehydrogenase family)
MQAFAGKQAVAVGGETGIGLAVSRQLVARGAEVVIAGILEPEGHAAAAELARNGLVA